MRPRQARRFHRCLRPSFSGTRNVVPQAADSIRPSFARSLMPKVPETSIRWAIISAGCVETQTYVKSVIKEYDSLQHETLDAQAPAEASTPAPVQAFDALVNNAQAGCDALGQSLLFIPLAGGASIAESLSAHSDGVCQNAGPRSTLSGIALLSSLQAH
jgi:hypothetical protein